MKGKERRRIRAIERSKRNAGRRIRVRNGHGKITRRRFN